MPSLSFETTYTGPLFDGSLQAGIDSAVIEMTEEVAQHGVNLVRQRLHSVLQHPTGRYESSIQTERRMDTNLITDGGMVYGPWLEGVGSRNSTSRFKGYATFRQIGPEVERLSQQIAEATLEQHLGGLL